MTTGKQGFTIIEIVICIALIGLLTAIAIPNHLRAKMSTDISTAKADLQTLKLGLESYKLDLGAYPWMSPTASCNASGATGSISIPTLERLTTPISYLSSTAPFYDPFEADRAYEGPTLESVEIAVSDSQKDLFKHYFYNARNLVDTSTWGQSAPQDVDPYWYFLESAGPDKHHHYMWQIMNQMTTDTAVNRATLSKTIYDPTNGAVSRGSIWEVGGDIQGRGTSMATIINAANGSNVTGWQRY